MPDDRATPHQPDGGAEDRISHTLMLFQSLGDIREGIGELRAGLCRVEDRVTGVEARVAGVEARLEDVRQELDGKIERVGFGTLRWAVATFFVVLLSSGGVLATVLTHHP